MHLPHFFFCVKIWKQRQRTKKETQNKKIERWKERNFVRKTGKQKTRKNQISITKKTIEKIYRERKHKKWKKWNQKERKIERKEERTKESKKETIISVFPEKTFKKLYCT